MNKLEIQALKDIKSDVAPFVKNIELNKLHSHINFKIYVCFDTLHSVVEKYCGDKYQVKEYFHYEYNNSYPVSFVSKGGKYYIRFYKNYLPQIDDRKIDVNVLVKNMRKTDEKIFKIVRRINKDGLFSKLDKLIDKTNIARAITYKGEF
jgi:hypothetical protein